MRLFHLTTAYAAYLRQFYGRNPGLAARSFAEQKRLLDADSFGWSDAWSRALAPMGYESTDVYLNADPVQRAWAREQGLDERMAPEEIAVQQIRSFHPDILWFDHHDEALVRRIRATVPSIRLVLGWSGKPLLRIESWRSTDLVLSCDPGAVDALRRQGLRVELLHHAFDDRVLDSLVERPPVFDVSFVGQIAHDFSGHHARLRLFERLLSEVDLAIFSPSGHVGAREWCRIRARQALYHAVRLSGRLGVRASTLRRLPVVGRAAEWTAPPGGPPPARLRRRLRPPRFGIEMYQTLRDSKVTLDVSSGAASNMRLFEATGAGACLLAGAANNLTDLFEPEREVVTYRDDRECVERVRWLLDHPAERQAIARAGQARTLKEHTFRHRAVRLDQLIRGAL